MSTNEKPADTNAGHGGHGGHGGGRVTYTIDGTSFTTRDAIQEAANMLRLAGLDPALFDLAKVRKHGQPVVFRDSKLVEIDDGDVFVSVRQSAQVA
jgi:hypothetical protein